MRPLTSTGARVLLAALLSVTIAGCIDDGTNPGFTPSSLWEGTLIPAALGPGSQLPEVSGAVAVVVQSGVSRVGMGLEGVDRELYWAVFNGTCTDPGASILPVTAFPTLPADASDVQYRISEPLMSGGSYHVRLAVDAQLAQSVACGNLQETSAPTAQ